MARASPLLLLIWHFAKAQGQSNESTLVETPLHPKKVTVWCALWAGGIILPYVFKNDNAPASVIEEMLLPLLFGFLIKIVFGIFAALFKLLIVGIVSLGTSGLSLVLASMLAKKNFYDKPGIFGFDKGWNGYLRGLRLEKGLLGHHAVQEHLPHMSPQLHNYRSDRVVPFLYKPVSKHPRSRDSSPTI